MVVIGITGGTGAGKTTALNVLRAFGTKIIDCDELYHSLMEACVPMRREIGARFGLAMDAGFDRKKLGEIVFGDPAALGDLNAITHKYVMAELQSALSAFAAAGETSAAIDAILLLESGAAKLCFVTVGVIADPEIRAERIMKRERIGRTYALSRISAQKSNDFFIQNCDYILENNCSPSEFEAGCRTLFSKILGGTSDE